jgi:hypothetical protein
MSAASGDASVGDMRRALRWLVVVAVLLVLVFYVGGGWYFAGRINSGALAVQHPADKAVELVDRRPAR